MLVQIGMGLLRPTNSNQLRFRKQFETMLTPIDVLSAEEVIQHCFHEGIDKSIFAVTNLNHI